MNTIGSDERSESESGFTRTALREKRRILFGWNRFPALSERLY
jgi:hypothetical protein